MKFTITETIPYDVNRFKMIALEEGIDGEDLVKVLEYAVEKYPGKTIRIEYYDKSISKYAIGYDAPNPFVPLTEEMKKQLYNALV
jgi:hypothetical protein